MSADELDQLLDAISKVARKSALDQRRRSVSSNQYVPPSSGPAQLQTAYPQVASAPVAASRLEIISKNLNNLIPPNRGEKSPYVSAPPPVQNRSLPPDPNAGYTAFATYASGDSCATCNRPITHGQMLRVEDRAYHVDHFVCQKCNRSIGTEAYFRSNGRVTCKGCTHFDVCAGCSRQIESGERVRALNQVFHGNCFCCSSCRQPLSEFFDKEGRLFCTSCFNNTFGKKCGGCHQNIGSMPSLIAFGKNYHNSCFVCSNCRQEIGNSGFYTTIQNTPRCTRCGPGH